MSEIRTSKDELVQARHVDMSWRTGITYATAFLLLLGIGFACGMTYQEALSEAALTEIRVTLDHGRRQLKYEDGVEQALARYDKQLGKLLWGGTSGPGTSVASNTCLSLRDNIQAAQVGLRHLQENRYQTKEELRRMLDEKIAKYLKELEKFNCK